MRQQEAEVFVPPGSGGAWGSGGGGEDSATCRSTQSADSMGTPQSHFKARPQRLSSKRALGEDMPPSSVQSTIPDIVLTESQYILQMHGRLHMV